MKFSDGANIVICGEVLGIGAYAEVRVALHKATQDLVAAKIFDLERGLEKSISREIKILNPMCVLVEELAITDLFSVITNTGAFPECLARKLFFNLVSAVDSLHTAGIIH